MTIAIYSADDQSLCFYRREQLPEASSQFEGKTVTAAWDGIDGAWYRNGTRAPWYYNHAKDILTVTVMDDGVRPQHLSHWFARLSNAKSIDVSKLDTSNVTDINNTFYGCSAITSLDLSGWDTSNVTSLYFAFSSCSSLTSLDLSGWDTSKVTLTGNCFDGCPSLFDVKVGDKWTLGQIW